MATTANYGWTTPDDTGYVKDGALAIRTLGNAIDTTVDSIDDRVDTLEANDIPKTLIDAKGDLLAGTAADTIARLAVGTNGQVLTADSSETTGLKWATPSTGGGGLTLITAQTLSGAGATSFNNVFTSTYDNYRIMVDLIGSADTYAILRLRVSGSDDAGNNYRTQYVDFNGTTVAAGRGVDTNVFVALYSTTARGSGIIDVFGPNLVRPTGFITSAGRKYNDGTNNHGALSWNGHTQSTAYNGFSIIPNSGTFTGTIRVYGYQNS